MLKKGLIADKRISLKERSWLASSSRSVGWHLLAATCSQTKRLLLSRLLTGASCRRNFLYSFSG